MADGTSITMVVYDPPKPGLPYLAVMIAPDGKVSAVGYASAAEAEAHNAKNAADAGLSSPDKDDI